MPPKAKTASAKDTDAATNADDIGHTVTIPTAEYFERERWRQINALLMWNVTRTAAAVPDCETSDTGRFSQ
ncbi:MAG: hypothetical protein ABGZ53_04425 [Fuerstiella sp.]